MVQPDGSVTPLNSVQNFVLSEQQAGEILAQVFMIEACNKTLYFLLIVLVISTGM